MRMGLGVKTWTEPRICCHQGEGRCYVLYFPLHMYIWALLSLVFFLQIQRFPSHQTSLEGIAEGVDAGSRGPL